MRRIRSDHLVPGEKPWDLNLSMVPIGLIMAVLGSMNSIVHFMSVFFSPAKSVFIVRNCRGNPRQRGHSHSEADPGIIKSWYLSLGHANYVPAEKISIRYHCIELYCPGQYRETYYYCKATEEMVIRDTRISRVLGLFGLLGSSRFIGIHNNNIINFFIILMIRST